MTKKLILVCGVAGSGKTLIGKQICKAMSGCVFIDKDTISRFFSEALLQLLKADKNDRESDTYFSHVRPVEYDTLFKHAMENVEIGRDVVCAAPFLQEIKDAQWIENLTQDLLLLDAKLIKIWIQTDERTARSRIISRAAPRDNGKLADWENYVQRVKHEPPNGAKKLIIINNGSNPEIPVSMQVQTIVKIIAQGKLNA